MSVLRKIAYFFTDSSTPSKRGKRFRDGDKPNQETFEDLFTSQVFRTESEHKAGVNDGSDNAKLNGHVRLASNPDSKDKVVQTTQYSTAVQPHQIPDVTEDSIETFQYGLEPFNGATLEVEENKDNFRLNYKLSLKEEFVIFLQKIFNAVSTSTSKVTNLEGDVETLEVTVASLQEQINTLTGSVSVTQFPIGGVMAWSKYALPNGSDYLPCDGQLVLINDYPLLYAVIEQFYKKTDTPLYDEATHFPLPSWNQFGSPGVWSRGYSLVGAATPGQMFGRGGRLEQTIELKHIPNHIHSVIGRTNTDGTHTHRIAHWNAGGSGSGTDNAVAFRDSVVITDTYENTQSGSFKLEAISSGSDHNHGISLDSQGILNYPSKKENISIENPYATVRWCIKAK